MKRVLFQHSKMSQLMLFGRYLSELGDPSTLRVQSQHMVHSLHDIFSHMDLSDIIRC